MYTKHFKLVCNLFYVNDVPIMNNGKHQKGHMYTVLVAEADVVTVYFIIDRQL